VLAEKMAMTALAGARGLFAPAAFGLSRLVGA